MKSSNVFKLLDCFASLRGSAFASAPHARNDGLKMSLRGAQSATKQSSKNNAFTLAEIMIVLTVIGILTAILLPAARQITPDENVIKFKKAHNTLYSVIRELVTSDKYYLDGDLGIKPDGTFVDSPTYLCETIGDIVVYKKINCQTINSGVTNTHFNVEWNADSRRDYSLDIVCQKTAAKIGAEIILPDGVVFYNSNPFYHFNSYYTLDPDKEFNGTIDEAKRDGFYYQKIKENNNPDNLLVGSYSVYKTFCIDIDGIPSGVTQDDCVNECPFGYGIRVDGKIMNGARATQWLNKSIQGED